MTHSTQSRFPQLFLCRSFFSWQWFDDLPEGEGGTQSSRQALWERWMLTDAAEGGAVWGMESEGLWVSRVQRGSCLKGTGWQIMAADVVGLYFLSFFLSFCTFPDAVGVATLEPNEFCCTQAQVTQSWHRSTVTVILNLVHLYTGEGEGIHTFDFRRNMRINLCCITITFEPEWSTSF